MYNTKAPKGWGGRMSWLPCLVVMTFCMAVVCSCGTSSKDSGKEQTTKTSSKKKSKAEKDPAATLDLGDNPLVLENVLHVGPEQYKGRTDLTAVYGKGETRVVNDEAFKGCTSIKLVYMDCWTVGLDAFNGCKELTDVSLGAHSWQLRKGAFANCPKLKKILLGLALEKIEEGAFEGSLAIEEFAVPHNARGYMFRFMPALKNVKKVYLLTMDYYAFPKTCNIPDFPSAQTTLYVPDAMVDAFKGDATWSKAGAILPLSQSEYYTADGTWK